MLPITVPNATLVTERHEANAGERHVSPALGEGAAVDPVGSLVGDNVLRYSGAPNDIAQGWVLPHAAVMKFDSEFSEATVMPELFQLLYGPTPEMMGENCEASI